MSSLLTKYNTLLFSHPLPCLSPTVFCFREGAVIEKMCEGIDYSRCVAVFITEIYESKVTGLNKIDNCKLEFGYAVQKKTPALMIPVVLEANMCNTRAWKGQLGMILGPLLFVDMSDPAQLEAKIDELYNTIVAKVKIPLLALLEKQRALLAADASLSSSVPSPIVANPTTLEDPESIARQEWIMFFTTKLRFMPRSAQTYATYWLRLTSPPWTNCRGN